jgi:hypothetical protein
MKRVLSLLCAILMLTSVVACGKTEEPAVTTIAGNDAATEATTAATEPAETEPPKAFDSVAEQNLGGDFQVLYAQADNCYEDFHAETLTGDVKNDLIYERNLMVEEKLGVDIQISWTDYKDVDAKCQLQVQSGSDDYDLFGGHRISLALSYQGMQYNIKDITTIDLTKEWWDQGYVDAITINDSLYTVIGDIGVSTLLFVSSLTFNKRLMDEANIAYPYDLVRDGKWTMDALYNMTVDYGSDLNGDGQVKREDDLLSIVGWSSESGYSNFYSTGFAFINRDAAGDYAISYDSERLNAIIEKVVALWTTDYAYNNMGSGTAEHEITYGIFPAGRALFSDIVLSKIGTFYSDMNDDYGILPLPKYDENQESYKSYLGFTIPILYLPNNAADAERTGTIMEALCTASYDNVTPKMYEIVTKLKNARDEDSSEMIEIIIRNKFIDTAHFFDVEGYGTLPRNVITQKSTNVASMVKAFERIAAKEWDKIIDGFDKLG